MEKKHNTLLAAIIICGSLLSVIRTSGQPDGSGSTVRKVMTLHDCMEYAVANSTKMKISRTELSDARADRRESVVSAFAPEISANTYLYGNFGRAVDPETNTYISSTSLNNGYSVSAGIMLFDGFRAVNRMKVTGIAVRMGQTREQQYEDEICLAAMQAYCNVVYYTKMAGVFEAFVDNARENLQLAVRQKELGQKGRSEVVQMEAELADREFDLVTMENRRDDAMLTLKEVMCWPVSGELQIDMTFVDQAPSVLNTDAADYPQIVAQAKVRMPSVLLAEARMRHAKVEWNSAKWRLAPSLSLTGGWSTSYYTYPGKTGYIATPFGRQFVNNGGEFIQLSLSIPILGGWSRMSGIVRKKNEYRRASYEYEQSLRNIETEVARAIQDRDGAGAALNQAIRRSSVQEEAYQLNLARMARGLISSVEFQTVTNRYLKSEAECLNARLQYLLKDSIVKYYKGISYLNQ